MNSLTKTILSVALGSGMAMAQAQVSSKGGVLTLKSSDRADASAVCEVDAGEIMQIITEKNTSVMVSAKCGKGWLDKESVAYYRGSGNKDITLGPIDIEGWIDNPFTVFVLEDDTQTEEGVDLNRNFKDYLVKTQDRESMEFARSEN